MQTTRTQLLRIPREGAGSVSKLLLSALFCLGLIGLLFVYLFLYFVFIFFVFVSLFVCVCLLFGVFFFLGGGGEEGDGGRGVRWYQHV